MSHGTPDVLAKVLRDRRLDREDLQERLDGARDAAAKGYYAQARAMLSAASRMLVRMQERDAPPEQAR